MSQGLVLFDFDGTITRSDTLYHFLRYTIAEPRFYVKSIALLPVLLGYKLGLLNNSLAKSIVLCYFFQGWSAERLRAVGESFSRDILPGLIRPRALLCIREHQMRGDRILVVSASLSYWVRGWCIDHGLEFLATEVDIAYGWVMKDIADVNCYGPEKVRRIKSCLNLADYYPIYAYGDSVGDHEMLALAHKQYYKPFR